MNKSTDHSDEKAYRRLLFELGSLVNGNRARSHAHRSQIISNVTSGLTNLLTAFSRNRNLMSESTTNIYRSRRVFVESNADYLALNPEQRRRVMDEIEYQCLKQRSDSNREIMTLNVALTRFNQEFVQLLQAVNVTNAAKLHFNDIQHELNAEILEKGLGAIGLTDDIAEFGNLVTQLTEQVTGNCELLEEGFEASSQNEQRFNKIREALDAELAAIDDCWDRIEAQQALAAEFTAEMAVSR